MAYMRLYPSVFSNRVMNLLLFVFLLKTCG